MVHVKKVLPEYFEALANGEKRFELRKEDPSEPSFAVGDILALNEYDPAKYVAAADQYTGRCMFFKINYILRDCDLLADGCVALSLSIPLKLSTI